MNKIEQTYAWSNSRIKIFRECPWRYYLTYFLAWEGWLTSAPQEKRSAYILKNLTNLPMWAGEIVHNIIEEIISTARKTGEWKTLKQAQHDGVQELRKGWQQSVGKEWLTSPKKVNLSEHYYDQKIAPDKLQSYKQKVLKSLQAFYDIPLFEIMRNLPSNAWLTIEDFAQFELNTKERVSVKIDCGFRYNGKVYLLDWKTGKIDDNVIAQLTTYSMYGIKMGWATKPEDIVIIPVYLAAYAELGEQAIPHLDVTMEHMKRQAKIIRDEYPLLTAAFEHKDDPDYFEKTDNENACKWCFFRDMCKGAKTEIDEGVTPF